jgi:hypothetical protein
VFEGEFTKAIEAHNRAIELSPTNPELWTEKGITFFKKFLRDDGSSSISTTFDSSHQIEREREKREKRKRKRERKRKRKRKK